MAPRRSARRRETALSFDALSIEGALLSPAQLTRIAQVDATRQSPEAYGVPKGLQLRDEIGRYWRIGQAMWREFESGRAGGADPAALSKRFVLPFLRTVMGFGSLAPVAPVVIGDRTFPIGHAALEGRVPVVIAPAGSGLDAPLPAFGDGLRRRSAFGLAQEFLNADENALWGLVTDGVTLRLVRDNASLTRPAWIEADLSRLFVADNSGYPDFSALWLLIHESRFGREGERVHDGALETWRQEGREEGTRAREKLRDGVEAALRSLGQGFLSHADNEALRERLRTNALTQDAYFQQLLRLVYRVIFLLTLEERGLLHPEGTDDEARSLYADGYSLKRLRDRALRRSAFDRYSDAWEAVRITFRGLAAGESMLGLPALAGLFAVGQCPDLDGASVQNRDLLTALYRLGWIKTEAGLSRVNWRDMGAEEFGGVYESLLELVPQVTKNAAEFTFATGAETKGNARKTTGSYYTPDSLVQVLLDSALEPVIQETVAKNPGREADALLELSIVDPACGSGHFILAAARRLAGHVARATANGTPTAAEYRHALRQVVSRCIYGVDLNLMAVELCRVGLWLEAVEPGRPLTFLDSHIQHGNALLGTTPELMAKGIPNDAWDPIEGDDRKTATALKRRNRMHAQAAQTIWSFATHTAKNASAQVKAAVDALDAADDSSLGALAAKEQQWAGLLSSEAYKHQKFVADAWCAAFVWPMPVLEKVGDSDPMLSGAPTNEVWRDLRDGKPPSETTRRTVDELAQQYRFLHWHLAFPRVFEKGGFDVVLGNPPWERVKLSEQEFFASHDEAIATAPNAAARKGLIATLPSRNPRLWTEWCEASRGAEGQSHSLRNSGRYPLCGTGDVNTYALFAEHNRAVLNGRGRAGFIVPTGIATDDTTKEYFAALVAGNQLAALYSFENGEGIFPAVHKSFNLALVTLDASGRSKAADLVFYVRNVAALREQERHFTLSAADFALLNPNTKTCPTFRSKRDAEINLAMYRRAGVLWREEDRDGNPWTIRFMAMLHMTSDAGLFRTRAQLEASGYQLSGSKFSGAAADYVPMLEAKMVHHFNHRLGDYAARAEDSNDTQLPEVPVASLQDPNYQALPRYWVPASEVTARVADRWKHGWLLGWRDICRATDERTVIASIFPRTAVGNTTPLVLSTLAADELAQLYAMLSSFALDYAARQKVGGTHLNYLQLKQLPVFSSNTLRLPSRWLGENRTDKWILSRVLELTYTAWDLEPFARDVGYDGPPFRWDPERRFQLRCELDAAFFHLYRLSRDDTDYVMETFPIVRRNDEKAYGEYRTKRVILEVYDAMAEAIRTGKPYQTRLDPPPADPRVAHPESTRPGATKGAA